MGRVDNRVVKCDVKIVQFVKVIKNVKPSSA